MIIDQTGSLANVRRHDYLPFGEELFGGTNANPGPGGRKPSQGYGCDPSDLNCLPDGTRQQFSSKDRDNATGLDYFGYRYYVSTQGRWISVDPLIDFQRSPGEPQAWNLYQYCINNPLTRTDPDGRQDSVRLNGTHAIEQELRKNGYSEEQIKIFMEEYRRSQKRALKISVATLAGLGVVDFVPAIAEALFIWAARNPDRVEQAGQLALEAAGGPPSLISAPNSRLRPTEVDSLTRLSKQLGSTLIESAHEGEEVIVAGTNKTIDVMGHGSFYKHPQFVMSEFFNSIKEHVTSSVTYIAIDLKGASKDQIVEITAYVNKLDKALRDKVIYISPGYVQELCLPALRTNHTATR
jgi:RHS repeat-associated protein